MSNKRKRRGTAADVSSDDENSSDEIQHALNNNLNRYPNGDDTFLSNCRDCSVSTHLSDSKVNFVDITETSDTSNTISIQVPPPPMPQDDRFRMVKVTTRSGVSKSAEISSNSTIYIVPIVEEKMPAATSKIAEVSAPAWPSRGPKLQALCDIISAFFGRKVEVLDSITVKLKARGEQKDSSDRSMQGTACHFEWKTTLPSADQTLSSCTAIDNLQGRIDLNTDHFQLNTNSILNMLKTIKHDGFAIVGVTMCDLYSSSNDNNRDSKELFMAGGAWINDKIAVTSFCRYDALIKSSKYDWYDYGYLSPYSSSEWMTNNGYYYDFDNNNHPVQRPIVKDFPDQWEKETSTSMLTYLFDAPTALPLSTTCNTYCDVNIDKQSTIMVRRAAKLIVHEIGHLYDFKHCTKYSCNMNGTSNLIEDYAAPSHFCVICLHKLQHRLRFDLCQRYVNLCAVYQRIGMNEEADWCRARVDDIRRINSSTGAVYTTQKHALERSSKPDVDVSAATAAIDVRRTTVIATGIVQSVNEASLKAIITPAASDDALNANACIFRTRHKPTEILNLTMNNTTKINMGMNAIRSIWNMFLLLLIAVSYFLRDHISFIHQK